MTDIVKALNDVREQATELQKLPKEVIPLCEDADEVRGDGVSLLQVKYATLMRYNLNLTKLALARVRGESITKLAKKLVEDSIVLSKLRPIERKLQHHIELLLKGGRQRSTSTNQNDGTSHLRPNPSDIVVDEDERDGGHENENEKYDNDDMKKDDGIYRPPRLAEVVYDATAERKRERKEKEEQRFRERALRSESIREMVAEVKGLPEQIGMDGFGDATKSSKQAAQVRREDESRRKFEEKNFTRLNLTGKDKKRRRDMMRAAEKQTFDGSSEFNGLASMADRVVGHKSKKRKGGNHDNDDEDDEEARIKNLNKIFDEAE